MHAETLDTVLVYSFYACCAAIVYGGLSLLSGNASTPRLHIPFASTQAALIILGIGLAGALVLGVIRIARTIRTGRIDDLHMPPPDSSDEY